MAEEIRPGSPEVIKPKDSLEAGTEVWNKIKEKTEQLGNVASGAVAALGRFGIRALAPRLLAKEAGVAVAEAAGKTYDQMKDTAGKQFTQISKKTRDRATALAERYGQTIERVDSALGDGVNSAVKWLGEKADSAGESVRSASERIKDKALSSRVAEVIKSLGYMGGKAKEFYIGTKEEGANQRIADLQARRDHLLAESQAIEDEIDRLSNPNPNETAEVV